MLPLALHCGGSTLCEGEDTHRQFGPNPAPREQGIGSSALLMGLERDADETR